MMKARYMWLAVVLCGLVACSGSGSGDVDSMADFRAEDQQDPPPVPDRVDYLIVTADGLEETADAFAAYRRTMGYNAQVLTVSELSAELSRLDDDTVAAALQKAIREHHAQRDPQRPFYLLLVGDARPNDSLGDHLIPAPYCGREHCQTPCYSDNAYGDVDGDDVPDLAVGRLPVRSNEKGLLILEKVKAHEAEYEVGLWNRRLSVYAGEGDFGSEIDTAIEAVTQYAMETTIPYDFDLHFAYQNPNSDYYYQPFAAKVLAFLTEGALLVAYMGHGGGELDVDELAALQVQHRYPMLAFFACGTGDFLSVQDCEAERLMKQSKSPMALLVSQGETHPYGNAILARELAMAIFVERVPTYGEAVRRMKWRVVHAGEDEFRQLVDTIAPRFISTEEMKALRVSHQYLYNLLGDPALSMRYPYGTVTIEADPVECDRGGTMLLSGVASGLAAGTAHITLETERSAIPWELEPVGDPLAPSSWPTVQANYEKAADKVVARTDVPITSGEFAGQLTVPTDIRGGQYYLKVYAEDGTTDAIGHVQVQVR